MNNSNSREINSIINIEVVAEDSTMQVIGRETMMIQEVVASIIIIRTMVIKEMRAIDSSLTIGEVVIITKTNINKVIGGIKIIRKKIRVPIVIQEAAASINNIMVAEEAINMIIEVMTDSSNIISKIDMTTIEILDHSIIKISNITVVAINKTVILMIEKVAINNPIISTLIITEEEMTRAIKSLINNSNSMMTMMIIRSHLAKVNLLFIKALQVVIMTLVPNNIPNIRKTVVKTIEE